MTETPTFETIRLEVRDGVAHLTLQRPDAANGISLALARDLDAATRSIEHDAGVRAVLLTGAGARFCGGGDVKEFAEHADDLAPHLEEVLEHLHPAVERLVRGVPVVAAVQGSAAGAGLGLVAASDIVVAGESAKFVMAYTAIGVTPDGSSSWFLPRLVGLKRALELTLLNRPLTATEARDWGLITQVVPDAEVAGAGAALAATLAQGPTGAFRGAKRLLHGSLQARFEEHLALEAELIAAGGRTHDAVEGMRAFVDKRRPEFRGE
jgi:2-(1,2-epoxy-1,2-dihydrophenyl)acetyl-CoA isomerase